MPGYHLVFNGGDDRVRANLAGTIVTGPVVAQDDTWHHVAMVVDRDVAAHFYVDGVHVTNDTAVTGIAGAVSPSQDLWIGRWNDFSDGGGDGWLDDLRFYTGTLMAGEVAALFQDATYLAAHYEFEGDGRDSAGGAHGVIGANVSFSPGDLGEALTVGVSGTVPQNVITVPHALVFRPDDTDFSIALWVKRNQADAVNADGLFDALNGTVVGYQSNFRAGGDLNKMGFRLDDDAGNFVLLVDTAIITDTDAWHHFALVVSRATSSAIVYRDGEAGAALSIAGLSGAIVPGQDLWIGGLNNASHLGLDGHLSDLRFYSRELTAAEVRSLWLMEDGDDQKEGTVLLVR